MLNQFDKRFDLLAILWNLVASVAKDWVSKFSQIQCEQY